MTFHNREELIEELRRLKRQLQSVWPIESLALFGSWVREDATPASDVDLLIQFRPGAESDKIGAFEFVEIQLRLQEALGCKVDLVEKSALKPRLAKYILPEAIEL